MSSAEPLQEWVRAQLAAGLPALAGTRVSGRVPIQVDLLNDLIAGALSELARPRDPANSAARGSALPMDLPTLIRHVRRLRVDAAPGTVTLDFEIGIDG